MKFIVRVLFGFVAPMLCFGQNADSYDYLSTANGLPANYVHLMTQDSSGFMWFATESGLAKYDGDNFEIFNTAAPDKARRLLSDNVTAVWVSPNKTDVWLGYFDKSFLSHLDLKTKNVTHFKIQCKGEIINKRITSITSFDSRSLWISFGYLPTRNKITDDVVLARFATELGTLEFFGPLPSLPLNKEGDFWWHQYNSVGSIYEKSTKDTLFLPTKNGLCIFKTASKTFEFITPKPVNTVPPGYYGINEMVYSKKTGFWLGQASGILANFNPNINQWKYFSPKQKGNNSQIFSLCIVNEGELFLGYDDDLISFNISDGSFRTIYAAVPRVGFKEEISVLDFFLDRQKNVWLSHHWGLSKLRHNGRLFESYPIPVVHPREGKTSGAVVSIVSNKQNNETYFGLNGSSGFIVENQVSKKFTVLSIPQLDIGTPRVVRSVILDRENLPVVLCSDAVFTYDPKNKSLAAYANLANKNTTNFIDGVFDNKGSLWATSETCLYKILPGNKIEKFTSQTRPGEITSDKFLNCTKDQSGNIWFDNAADRIVIYDPQTDKFQTYKIKSDSVGQEYEILYGLVSCGKSVFVATHHGLLKCQFSVSSGMKWEKTSIENRIWNIWELNDSILYMRMDAGLVEYNTKSESVKRYGSKNGLPEVKTVGNNDGACIGNFGCYYKIINDEYSQIYFPVLITSFSVLGKEVVHDKKVSLNASDNFFSIKFAAPNFVSTEDIEYSYKMEGLSETWSPFSSKKTADFTNVPGGDYTFRVRYANSFNRKRELGSLALPIHIRTPFYKTNFFWLTIVVTILCTAYLIFRLYISFIRKQHKAETSYTKKVFELQASALRARINPHFLFNSLNSINNFLLKNDTAQASDYLAKVAKLIRKTLEGSNSQTITLRDELSVLQMYIAIEQGRFKSKFEYSFEVSNDINIDKIKIYPMIIQPYVENAIWHGVSPLKEGGHILIKIAAEEGMITVTITDNGVGRSSKSNSVKEKASLGHKITAERIETLNKLYRQNSSIIITDLRSNAGKASGTRITIIFDTLRFWVDE
ncbi:hypothetical protein WSM22_04140 [Cytophagales bacterium WSM2-2]|nr:hypothetical protein WSM22_04140 [Cytophagales bacterium WSM2-2]